MAALLRRGLQEEGFAVDVAGSGEDGTWFGTENDYDVILLDVMLPDIDGFEVCRRLRAADRWAPILMLTARDGVQDRVAGLDAGADDYLTKPFSFDELFARVRALLRRGPSERPPVLVGRRPRPRSGDPSGRAPRIRRSTSRRRSSVSSNCSSAIRARSCRARGSSSTSGTSPTTATRTWSTSTSGTSGRRSTAPSAAARSRRSEASGTACGRTRERTGDPDAADARLRGPDGRRPRCRRRDRCCSVSGSSSGAPSTMACDARIASLRCRSTRSPWRLATGDEVFVQYVTADGSSCTSTRPRRNRIASRTRDA